MCEKINRAIFDWVRQEWSCEQASHGTVLEKSHNWQQLNEKVNPTTRGLFGGLYVTGGIAFFQYFLSFPLYQAIIAPDPLIFEKINTFVFINMPLTNMSQMNPQATWNFNPIQKYQYFPEHAPLKKLGTALSEKGRGKGQGREEQNFVAKMCPDIF